jgi:hypothetical protein
MLGDIGAVRVLHAARSSLDVLDLMLPLSTNKQSWGGDLSLFAKAVPCTVYILSKLYLHQFSDTMLLTCGLMSLGEIESEKTCSFVIDQAVFSSVEIRCL